MAGSSFTGDLGEHRVFFKRESQIFVVLFEDAGDALFFLRRIECARGNFFRVDWFFIELPRNYVAIADAVKPGLLPSHQPVGNQFARQIRILRRKKLKLMQSYGIAYAPGRQREQAQKAGQENRADCATEFALTKQNKKKNHPGRNEK